MPLLPSWLLPSLWLFAASPAYDPDAPEVQALLDRLEVPASMRDTPEVQRLVENELGAPRANELPADPSSSFAEPEARSERARPAWADFLPRLSATGSAGTLGGRQDSRITLAAEIPIEPRPSRPVVPRVPVEDEPPALPFRLPACLDALRETAVGAIFAEGSRAQSLLSRARLAGWLPELRFRVERRMGRNESLDIEEAVGLAPLGLDTIDDVRYEVRATLDLGRAIFNPQELAASQQALRIADARREVQLEVNRLFIERRKLAAMLSSPPDKDSDEATQRENQAYRMAAVEEDLAALTRGLSQKCR